MDYLFKARRRNATYTVILAVLCAIGIIIPRSFAAGFGTVIYVGGIPIAYTDTFMFLAGGIGGLPGGILSFSLAFLIDAIIRPGNFYALYIMSTYLLLVLIAAGVAHYRVFAHEWTIPFLIAGLDLMLCILWQRTVVNARMPNPYSNMVFSSLLICALPESCLTVILQWAYFRFAPDSLKERMGSGWRYTKKFKNSRADGRTSVLGTRLLLMLFASTLLVSAVVIILATLQQNLRSNTPIRMDMLFTGNNYRLMMLSASISFPLSYLINLYAQNTIARPLNQMSFLMKQYFSGDNSSRFSQLPDLGIRSKDEIEVLYSSLQKMLVDMSGYMDAQTQKRQLEADLKVEKEAGKAKSDFLSSMSHEIRTPINAVLGLDEMILRESRENAVLEYAKDIQRSGKMLLSIINDILDFSKIEAGKMEIVPAEYETADMINNLVSMVAPRAEAKGLLFNVDAEPCLPRKLFGDDNRIKQCVLNLLTNAVKYTREGSVSMEVTLCKTGESGGRLTVRVIDTGIGIKKADIKKLYAPFERIEESRNRNIEGTGLGMSIVKGLLASMGGEMDVHSEYGKGSTFSISLDQEVRDWEAMGDWREAEGPAEDKGGQPRYTETFQAPEAKILVVDDTPLNLTVIKGLLKASRIQIDTAPDGEAGLELAKSTPYNVILIDHLMPKMDGIQMLSLLKQDVASPNRDTPCIALTANAISGAREEYLKAGFTDYLSKPVDPDLLESMISSLLPQTLVLRKGDTRFEERNSQITTANANAGAGSASDELFQQLFSLDIASALTNCGTKDIFLDTVKIFHDYIDSNTEKIESFSEKGDWKNYTILVHALKSSARLIGAQGLSDEAKRLEEYGKRAQEGNEEVVLMLKDRTPFLLQSYRSYREKLSPFTGL